MGRVIVGIDIGSTKICSVVGELDPARGLVLRGQPNSVPSEAVIRGTVRDLNQLAQDLDQSFSGALYRSGLSTDEVFVGINGREMSSETSTAELPIAHADGEVHQEDIDEILRHAAPALEHGRVVVHTMVKQWTLDGVRLRKSPLGMIGRRLSVETHTVTGAQAQLANLDRAIQRCGLKVRNYVHSLIAAGEAVLTPEEKNSGCILLDIGGGSTDVGVFAHGTLAFSVSIPLGAQSYVNDLKQGLGVSVEEAQRILKSHGRAWMESDTEELEDFVDVKFFGRREYDKIKRRRIFEIMQPRTDEMLELVLQAVHASGYQNSIASGAVLVGGGAALRKLRSFLQRGLGRQVRLGLPQGIGHLLDEYRTPAYAVALGLLLFGARQEEEQVQRGGGFFDEVLEAMGDIFRGLFRRRKGEDEEEG